jgi:hypothetical protein
METKKLTPPISKIQLTTESGSEIFFPDMLTKKKNAFIFVGNFN